MVAGLACTSSQPTVTAQATPPDTPRAVGGETGNSDWEEEARRRADRLLEQAQELASQGHIEQAVATVDDALCEVLATPDGYTADASYLDYLARLIEEAEALEEGLDVFTDVEAEVELIELPPIEIATDVEFPTIGEPRSLLPPSDFPLVLNSTVQRFLDAFTEPGEYRTRIETGLRRSGLYLPMIRAKFAAAGLPEDLGYLPLIESAFSLKAYSRARAHGMWQFIASTGRHYGLEIGALVDERRDPVRSTEAAVAYLADLHADFADWHLALAAYNSGAGNVRRAIRRSGSRDFWVLRRYLPRETRNYVPAFIASVIVANQPSLFDLPAPQPTEWRFDEITVPDALDLEFLASKTDIDLADLRELNPAIRRDLTPARRSTDLRLPPGKAPDAEKVLASVPRSEWAPRLIHTVRRGDSLYSIARRYNSSVSAIRQANGLRGSLIRPGQTLVVPRFGYTTAQPDRRIASDGSYVVQRHDTLWDIARSFDTSVNRLCAANGLERWQPIHPGQRLRIPAGSGPVESSKSTRSSTTYRVRKGDTLYAIARRFGVSVSALRRANGIRGSRIYPGDVLRIPVPQARG
jgi:membrane-bound lytic murein transglycosylase D